MASVSFAITERTSNQFRVPKGTHARAPSRQGDSKHWDSAEPRVVSVPIQRKGPAKPSTLLGHRKSQTSASAIYPCVFFGAIGLV